MNKRLWEKYVAHAVKTNVPPPPGTKNSSMVTHIKYKWEQYCHEQQAKEHAAFVKENNEKWDLSRKSVIPKWFVDQF